MDITKATVSAAFASVAMLRPNIVLQAILCLAA
jgi:hypothetical protein